MDRRGELREFPHVPGQEAQGRGEVGDGEGARREVGGSDGPGEFALAERDAGDEELEVAQRFEVELHLGLGGSEVRPGRGAGFFDGDALGHQAAKPQPAEALELEVETALLQLGEHGVLHEVGHADLVEPNECHQHREHEQPRHDADAAERDAADAPECPRFALGFRLAHGRSVMERGRPRPQSISTRSPKLSHERAQRTQRSRAGEWIAAGKCRATPFSCQQLGFALFASFRGHPISEFDFNRRPLAADVGVRAPIGRRTSGFMEVQWVAQVNVAPSIAPRSRGRGRAGTRRPAAGRCAGRSRRRKNCVPAAYCRRGWCSCARACRSTPR